VSKYLVLYRSPTSAREQMANATPEQQKAGMEAWQSWMTQAGAAIVDFGAPVQGEGDVTGYSILQADSRGALDDVLADHPHRHMRGASIDVLEFVALPGME
jgi:muconolactone delta-isomerase